MKQTDVRSCNWQNLIGMARPRIWKIKRFLTIVWRGRTEFLNKIWYLLLNLKTVHEGVLLSRTIIMVLLESSFYDKNDDSGNSLSIYLSCFEEICIERLKDIPTTIEKWWWRPCAWYQWVHLEAVLKQVKEYERQGYAWREISEEHSQLVQHREY